MKHSLYAYAHIADTYLIKVQIHVQILEIKTKNEQMRSMNAMYSKLQNITSIEIPPTPYHYIVQIHVQ